MFNNQLNSRVAGKGNIGKHIASIISKEDEETAVHLRPSLNLSFTDHSSLFPDDEVDIDAGVNSEVSDFLNNA